MNKEERAHLMGEGKIPSVLIKMALPAIIGMLVTAIYNVVDTFFVSKLGTTATGAVSVVYPLFMLISAVGLMYGIGASSIISRLLGERKKIEADKATSTTFLVSAISGILVIIAITVFLDPILKMFGASETILPFARDYGRVLAFGSVFTILNMTLNNILRAEGSAKFSMYSLLTGAIVNIILDPIFIFTFDMGIKGAAVATVVAQIVSTILLLSLFLRRKTVLHLSLRLFKPSLAFLNELYAMGLPTFIRQFLMSVTMGLLNTAAMPYGDEVLAAFGISSRLFSLAAMVIFGFAQGFQPLAGYNYGANKMKRVKESISTSIKWTSIFSLISGIIYFVFAPSLIAIFSKDAEVIKYGASVLRAMSVLFPLFGFQVIYGTLFQAIGKAKEAAFLSLSRQGIFLVPAILILPKIFGLKGVIYATPVADFLTIILTGILAIRVHKELNTLEMKQAA